MKEKKRRREEEKKQIMTHLSSHAFVSGERTEKHGGIDQHGCRRAMVLERDGFRSAPFPGVGVTHTAEISELVDAWLGWALTSWP